MQIPTPFYYVDEALLVRNLEILQKVSAEAECKILLAQKAFSMFSMYPLIGKYLSGTTASGLYEARLGAEEMGGETHIFSPAYTQNEFDDILTLCDVVVFNSFAQWDEFRAKALASGRRYGIRINPECPTGKNPLYDPCVPGSRLGVTQDGFRSDLLEGISGLHFHTLCEQNADDLLTTVGAVEKKFGKWLHQMDWLNIGGGHHITREDYDVDALIGCVKRLRDTYGVTVYIEPGEAVVLNAGFLTASVLELVRNGTTTAIMDASAACHMPDVLEVPYTPAVIGAGKPGEYAYEYRLAGPTCLAGDIVGDYAFPEPLKRGDRLTFCDMAHYTMVKNNTFNGMSLPTIAIKRQNGTFEVIKTFGYDDFKNRLS